VAQNGEIYNSTSSCSAEAEVERRSPPDRLRYRGDRASATGATASARVRPAARHVRHRRLESTRAEQLTLARDRVGKKPLCVFRTDRELLFGSEAKAILAVIDRTPDVFGPALLNFLTFGYVAGDESIFTGMSRLEPGTWMNVAADGHTIADRYWSWPVPGDTSPVSHDEAIEQLRAEADQAVKRSAAIGCAARCVSQCQHRLGHGAGADIPLSPNPVRTFTIGFKGPRVRQVEGARPTKHFGAQHGNGVVTPDCVKVADRLAWHYDEPFADASGSSYCVAELARHVITVVLTGDGGDRAVSRCIAGARAISAPGSARSDG
jgi:asparagine synthase (glutamine-hydrolysing)